MFNQEPIVTATLFSRTFHLPGKVQHMLAITGGLVMFFPWVVTAIKSRAKRQGGY